MRTNGLVWAIALSLSLAGRAVADEAAPGASGADAATPACGDQNSPSCNEGDVGYCCVPCNQQFWYAAAELSILHVDARPGSALNVTVDNTTNPGTDFVFSESSDFTNWGYAPRAWIGAHLSENWSVEGRFWDLHDSNSGFVTPTNLGAPINPGAFSFFYADSSIEAYTIDLDVIRTFNVGGWQLDAQLGARHGSFTSENIITGSSSAFTPTASIASDQLTSFNGTGFSYGGRVKHSIGGSNIFWVTSARGSYLSGEEHFDRPLVLSTTAGAVGTAPPRTADANLVIAEFQTGVEWDYALACIPATAFVRASYEFQDWHVNGQHSHFSGGGSSGNISFTDDISQGLGDMTLNGINLAAGIDW